MKTPFDIEMKNYLRTFTMRTQQTHEIIMQKENNEEVKKWKKKILQFNL